jgi:hypothetical protein
MLKRVVFGILGILTALVIFYAEMETSFSHFLENRKLLIAFAIVSIASSYAYFFIHKVLQHPQSDD